MNEMELKRFIHLLFKWQNDDLTWGECCELREFKYTFDDSIEEYYQNYTSSILPEYQEKFFEESDEEFLYNADENCKHEVERLRSGVKCKKCKGWYCLQ